MNDKNCLTCLYGPGDPFLLSDEMYFECRNDEAIMRIPSNVFVRIATIHRKGNILTTSVGGGYTSVITHCPAHQSRKEGL